MPGHPRNWLNCLRQLQELPDTSRVKAVVPGKYQPALPVRRFRQRELYSLVTLFSPISLRKSDIAGPSGPCEVNADADRLVFSDRTSVSGSILRMRDAARIDGR